jgi:hypothetical protein
MKMKNIWVGYMTYILQMLCADNVSGPSDISVSYFSSHIMKLVESGGSN